MKNKILIIDDEKIIRERLKNLLELDGFEVLAAGDGPSGLKLFNQESPAVALVDIKMPGIDGIEVLKKIRKSSPKTEVIIITGHGAMETAIQALSEGAFGYIQKPLEYDELKLTIERALLKQETEKKIKESEERYRDLFENANDLIQIVNGKAKFIDVNHKWLNLLEYTKQEALNLTLWDTLRPDQFPHCRQIFKEVLSGQTLSGFESVLVSKNGKEIYVEGSASPRFKNGKFFSARGIFRDVTKRRKAEDDLRKKILELERFAKVTMGRELRIIELKNKIAELEKRLEITGSVSAASPPPSSIEEPVAEPKPVENTGPPKNIVFGPKGKI